MACHEAEQLKQQVSRCTHVYLEADGQRSGSKNEGEVAILADFAMYALTDAKRKYWFHVNQHRCEPLEK